VWEAPRARFAFVFTVGARQVDENPVLIGDETMANLTPAGQRFVDDVSHRHGINADAIRMLVEALVSSGGGMAQFNHPDLGGTGQWSASGMIMIGDMFNNDLKSRIAALCAELSEVIRRGDSGPDRRPSGQWQSQGNVANTPLPESSFFVSGDNRSGGRGVWWRPTWARRARPGRKTTCATPTFPIADGWWSTRMERFPSTTLASIGSPVSRSGKAEINRSPLPASMVWSGWTAYR